MSISCHRLSTKSTKYSLCFFTLVIFRLPDAIRRTLLSVFHFIAVGGFILIPLPTSR